MNECGKFNNFCPFYYEKLVANYSDLIFMPYNYLLD